jgi:hypothetical protein
LSRCAAKPGTLLCALVAAVSALAAGVALSVKSEADVPLYQRRAAFEVACKDAADALFRLHLPSGITFADDCRHPKVTPFASRPGVLIVTRVVAAQNGEVTARRTYSALMDGRHLDTWRLIEVEPAPNELSVVQAPPALSPIKQLKDR